ncbi:MAG TPA: extensin family protein [Hyphomicrobiaceae bacterium]|nr:extensin family protein [Hyphomicrobiaceae bacterium]
MSSQKRQGRRRRSFAKFLLFMLVTASGALALWFGMVPRWINPLPRLDLSTARPWFVDFRLAALRRDHQLCAATLTQPHIYARSVDDKPIENGCGWENAVRISAVGGASLPVGTITCEMAAGLALWIAHDVQPLAQRLFGSPIKRVEHMGGYACRNIIGSKVLKEFRSQHARANAIDIAGFQLADGRQIRIARDWKGGDTESRFLKQAHRTACRYFRVALSPDFNAAHHDHFHFDRGPFVTCR